MDGTGRRTLVLWSCGGMLLSCGVVTLALLGTIPNYMALVAVMVRGRRNGGGEGGAKVVGGEGGQRWWEEQEQEKEEECWWEEEQEDEEFGGGGGGGLLVGAGGGGMLVREEEEGSGVSDGVPCLLYLSVYLSVSVCWCRSLSSCLRLA